MHSAIGKKGKDRISGFSGTITGYTEYISGCAQLLISPPVDKDGGYREGHWYDEQRVELESDPPVTLDNRKTPGFDKPAPVR